MCRADRMTRGRGSIPNATESMVPRNNHAGAARCAACGRGAMTLPRTRTERVAISSPRGIWSRVPLSQTMESPPNTVTPAALEFSEGTRPCRRVELLADVSLC
ncbi:hypothetical protein GFS60_02062 [Rhodococcus sp. WAY2]|nr:hypothetical protein GFS60_02062 [Rhodococcus sp. WAY2]